MGASRLLTLALKGHLIANDTDRMPSCVLVSLCSVLELGASASEAMAAIMTTNAFIVDRRGVLVDTIEEGVFLGERARS